MKTFTSTAKTQKTSYSTPSIKVIELVGEELLYVISGDPFNDGGDLARGRLNNWHFDDEEDDEVEF